MGSHNSRIPDKGFVHGKTTSIFNGCSSGDMELGFSNGRHWIFPDALPYYIYDCGYHPPEDFVNDIMNEQISSQERHQTRSLQEEEQEQSDYFTPELGGSIGYLSPQEINQAAQEPWEPPKEFSEKFLHTYHELIPMGMG